MSIEIKTPRTDEVVAAIEARTSKENAQRSKCAAQLLAISATLQTMIGSGQHEAASLAAASAIRRVSELIDLCGISRGEVKGIMAAVFDDAEDLRKIIFGGGQ